MNCSTLRIEFNQSHLDYYTELDAICLRGTLAQSSQMQPQNVFTHSPQRPSLTLARAGLSRQQKCVMPTNGGLIVRDRFVPTDILLRGFARLHIQEGLSAALDLSDNGYFDVLPV